MKVAIFYPMNLFASWYALGGYSLALETLEHHVLDCPFPGNNITNVEVVRMLMPKVEDLSSCDVIVSAFHEYTQPWLEAVYGWETWAKLMETVPVVARFDESMDRADLALPKRVPELKRWAHRHSYPAKQDADRYGGQWLPFGADSRMFKPTDDDGHVSPQAYELGFIGSMYPMRQKYFQNLVNELPPNLMFRAGQVIVQDLSGPLKVASTRLLAENYRRIKIFFCLPPVSRLLVAKVFEVMGCGTFLMYPELPGDSADNMKIFQHEKHLVYYKGGFFKKNVKQILHYLEHEEEREAIAQAGCELVQSEYTLDVMLTKLLELKDRWQEDWKVPCAAAPVIEFPSTPIEEVVN
jgi:hypothetical protein